MSLIREPNSRQSVFADAMLAVMSVERDNTALRVDADAKRLSGGDQQGLADQTQADHKKGNPKQGDQKGGVLHRWLL